MLGHMRLVMRSARKAVAADLADERLDRQVDLGVLAKIGLRCKARATLRANVWLTLIKRRVAPVARLRRSAVVTMQGRAQHQLLLLLMVGAGASRLRAGRTMDGLGSFGAAVAAVEHAKAAGRRWSCSGQGDDDRTFDCRRRH